MHLVARLVVGNASPVFEKQFGLSSRWKLDFESGMLLRSLEMPLQSTASPVEDFEKLDRNAHCDGEVDRFMEYQDNLNEVSHFFPSVLRAGQHAGLTQQETVAIYGWTSFEFNVINPIAWGKNESTFGVWGKNDELVNCTLSKAEVWPYIDVLISAMNKLPSAQPVGATLWRGSGMSAKELGNVITGGFSSTSTEFGYALEWLQSRRCGGSLWAIESHTSGKDISKFSQFEMESEVLFPMGSRLEVVECSPTTISNARQQQIKDVNTGTCKIDVICMKEAETSPPPTHYLAVV